MIRQIQWKGIEYDSIEKCTISESDSGTEIESVIRGQYHDVEYHLGYRIQVNVRWEILSVKIEGQVRNQRMHYELESDGYGYWLWSGQDELAELAGCTYVDISLTPFTNTLPIRRLKLDVGQESAIKVVYFDILEGQMKPVRQLYRRSDEGLYHFENVPNDFAVDIEVDDDGLVTSYPSLFKRL